MPDLEATARFSPTDHSLSRSLFEPLRISPPLRCALKRALDVGGAGAILLAVAPLLVVVAAMVWLGGGRPILYRHRRIGRNGQPFDCLKFRTMTPHADRELAALLARSPAASAEWEATHKLRDDPRILGSVGRFLRSTSLDELPQLFNVLRGEMSLVGPRPIVDAERAHYDAQLRWYFAARPGLTGPWQVSGRSDTSYATRVRLDVDYVKNPSLRRDLEILLRTASVIVRRKGAY